MCVAAAARAGERSAARRGTKRSGAACTPRQPACVTPRATRAAAILTRSFKGRLEREGLEDERFSEATNFAAQLAEALGSLLTQLAE